MNCRTSNSLRSLALACLVVPMFASYFFDDAFSSVSHLFSEPDSLELGWNAMDFGNFIGDYSLLCVFGGLIAGGVLLDIFGTRRMGSVFMGMMVLGGAIIWFGVSGMFPKDTAIMMGRVGRMLFGLGSEIAGVAVTRSVAKWFRDGNMSFAMGLQIGIARMGTAIALIAAPFIVGMPKDFYGIGDTARPILVGLAMLVAGTAAWFAFCGLDSNRDSLCGVQDTGGAVKDEDRFNFRDILSLLKNPRFIMTGILCVTFYCCVSSFKKFGTLVVIPRFEIEASVAGTMISMIPFCTIIFTPLFGILVDKSGRGTLWMILGSLAVLAGHLIITFAPQGVAFFGYFGIALLGLGYSLVPSAMWPSVPGIVPEKDLGTAFSLIYWIQNLGLFLVPKAVGKIAVSYSSLEAIMRIEYLFISLGVCAVAVALLLHSVPKNKALRQISQKAEK